MIERNVSLLPGERILWEGLPSARMILRPIEVFLIPFSLLWGGFALFWNIQVWTNEAPLFFRLWGLPFLILGAYFIFGRFLTDAGLRRRLVYLVTDRRIIILKRYGMAVAKSLDIRRLPSIELHERKDGSGTIRFGTSAGIFGNGNFGIWAPTFDPTPQFIAIEDVQAVYLMIQNQADDISHARRWSDPSDDS